jgi:GNAT superfamily N-acetyltransferase
VTATDVREEDPWSLAEYASVPIAFEVRRVLNATPRADGAGFLLAVRDLGLPYRKDYDAGVDASPASLSARFDVSRWGIFAARRAGRRVGGAILAFDTPGLDMLEGRRDLAVVWDLRVAPADRGSGIGTALWRAAEAWASTRGCRRIRVETQDVNEPACRFYARRGCALVAVRPGAYADRPEETQFLFERDLARR